MSSLCITWRPSFLAKNELRKRLEAKEIRALKLHNGQTSKICPVDALKEYLLLTARKKEGPLFHNPKDGNNISIFQLRYHLCSMITEADPATKAKEILQQRIDMYKVKNDEAELNLRRKPDPGMPALETSAAAEGNNC